MALLASTALGEVERPQAAERPRTRGWGHKEYEGGDDTWTSPFAAENSGQADLQDPRRAKPSPHVDFPKRLEWQTFEYDWRGNTKKTDDDARGFYDRSLGPITNDTAKPYQLKSADNTTLGGPRTGSLETQYDAAGNLVRLQVKRNGPCLPTGSSCSQVFGYEWDEVGRLAHARRWDFATLPAITDPPPAGTPDADLTFGYDAGDQRVLKTAKDSANAERHTVYVFETLELRRAAYGVFGIIDTPDYEQSKWTETPFLYAHGVRLARVAWDEPDVPTIGGVQTHVLLELGDHLGSTSVTLDRATGELVERGTYQAYGGSESDYRPERWKGFREDYRFTGKEEDVEVGLQYFGKRYYAPLLNRWVSADPLAVHVPGEADLNAYAYVRGMALKATDPLGLECDVNQSCSESPTATFTQGPAQAAASNGHVLSDGPIRVISQPPPTRLAVRAEYPHLAEVMERAGIAPTAPQYTGVSPGEHALGHHKIPPHGGRTPYTSASTKLLGEPAFEGSRLFIDIDVATSEGAGFINNEQLRLDVMGRPGADAYLASGEREVLFKGFVSPKAVMRPLQLSLRVGGFGLQAAGVVASSHDVGYAIGTSQRTGSMKPVAAEALRQVGGWGGAWVGFKAGVALGAAAGIETGPGAVASGLAGGLVFGVAGYLGADWAADKIHEN